MIAEINHKVSSDLEDELTGNFFGTIRYLPFNRGLYQILKRYVVSDDTQVHKIISQIDDDDFEIEFWKSSDDHKVEIDCYIGLCQAEIGIEVKYRSKLSGDNQLEKEAATMLGEWCKSDNRIMLLVAKAEEAKDIYNANKNKTIFKQVHLACLSWQDILLGLNNVITINKFEERIVEDLRELLTQKGFFAFEGFDFDIAEVRRDVYYDFR